MHKLFKTKPFIIAEISANHNGSLDLAKKIILSAKKKGLIITKHYPANSKYQSNSYLKNAELFDRSVLNFFLRPETKQNYIHKICKFINSQ